MDDREQILMELRAAIAKIDGMAKEFERIMLGVRQLQDERTILRFELGAEYDAALRRAHSSGRAAIALSVGDV